MTQYLLMDGSSGNYASTSDAAGIEVAGDIEIVLRLSMDDWTPGASTELISKWVETGNQRAYRLRIFSDGKILVENSPNGTDTVNVNSSTGNTFSNGVVMWLKATLDVDNGASGRDYELFYSAEQITDETAVSWTQLGVTQTVAGTTSIGDQTSELALGSRNSGTAGVMAGRFYRAIIRDGIGGSDVADFNAADFTVGDTDTDTAVSSGTGETWTIHGEAVIVDDGVVSGGNPLLLLGVG